MTVAVGAERTYPLYVTAALIALATLVPWAPDTITTLGHDDPNTILQHALFGSPLVYGRDILFTHGPWAIWYFRHYWPTSYGPLVLSHLVVALALACFVADVAARALASRALQLAVVVLMLAVFAVDFDARLYLLIAAVPLVFDERAQGARAWIAPAFAALAAFGGLVKVSALVIGLGAVGTLSLYEIAALRRLPRTGLGYLAGLVVFDLAATQDPRDLGAYVLGALDVARGYAEAIGYSKSASLVPLGPVLYAVAALGFGAVVVAAEWRRRRAWGLAFALSHALVVFGIFKSSFVIDNFQHWQHVSALLPLALCHGLVNASWLLGREIVARHRRWALTGVAAFAFAAIFAVALAAKRDPGLYDQKLAKLADNLRIGFEALRGSRATLQARHEAALAAIRERYPLPPIDVVVAMVGPRQSIGLAHGFDLRPLPTINVYQVWTPALVAATAAMFEAPDRPPRVLVDRFSRADRGYWLSLVEHYRRLEASPDFVLLEAAPRTAVTRGPTRRIETEFGRMVEVEANGFVWAEARIVPTAFGRLFELAFKKPEVFWRIELADGGAVEVRGGPILAEAGFLLSPAGATIDDLFPLDAAARDRSRRAVRRLVVTARAASAWLYESKIEIALTPLVLPERR
jgi:hypothetical protein